MSIDIHQLKSLRDKTGVSIQLCKSALEEANGDEAKAIEILRKKGAAKAEKRSDRSTGEGTVQSYIHGNGKIGVLIQLNCETDFVAKNEEFVQLARDLAMHVAATAPKHTSPDEVPAELVAKEKEIWTEQLQKEGKPENIMENILTGKEKKFREENALLTQQFVKNPDKTVGELLKEAIHKLGENITVGDFMRYSI